MVVRGLSTAGVAVGTAFFAFSLMPRDAVYQAIASHSLVSPTWPASNDTGWMLDSRPRAELRDGATSIKAGDDRWGDHV